jgi:ABC-type bacteriocin/lantibiotic exporter with double-glycine peptidase domain
MILAQGFTLAANLIQQYLLSFVAVKVDSAVLDFLTRYLLALPMSYFTSRRTGDIQRRLDGARQIRAFMMQQALGGVLSLVHLVGSLLLMLVYSPFLTGVFLLSVPLYAGLMRFSYKVLRPLYADLEEGQAHYSSSQIDAIKGIEAVKAAAAEQAFRDEMLNEFLALARKRFRGNFVGMSYHSMLQVVGLLNTTLFLWFAANLVIGGGLTVGGFVAFNTLIGMASAAILRTLGLWDGFQMVMVLMNRLSDVFEQEPEQGRDRQRLIPVHSLEGHIKLRNVSFRYGGPEAPVILNNINLEIAPGRTVAVVGRSGCGKTTLIKLLSGLLEPTEGLIRFDHVDMRTLNYRDLRRQIGIVLQENHMFGDTIMHNIAFGDPEPDFKKVLRASHLANAHEFIMRLPLGYETLIGETGLALSGGQRQRISIARALYHDPPVLIFDEATSALDTESERAIQSNLTSVMANRTTIVIAHRLSTIREADLIVVLEKGSIVESGTHQELIEQRGLYFYLSSQQLGI